MLAIPPALLPLLAIAAVVALSAPARAQIYKCQINGKTVFSDQPCAPDAAPIKVQPARGHSPTEPAPPAALGTSATSQPLEYGPAATEARLRSITDDMSRQRQLREIEHQIKIEYLRINDEEDAMQGEIAALRARKRRANNNLAGAVLEQSISNEMAAVTSRYETRIQTIRSKIDRLESERRILEGK